MHHAPSSGIARRAMESRVSSWSSKLVIMSFMSEANCLSLVGIVIALVVMIIISILMAVAIPVFLGQKQKALGRVRTRRSLKLKVPAGVDTGTRIQLTGEGEVGPGGGPAGDLYVEVHEKPHPVFTRDGDDLHCRLSLPMTAAALGTTMKLDTLDGEEELDITPGTQPDAVLTLRARGIPHLRGTGRGDIHVHLDVQVPTRLDAAQEQLLRDLAKLRGEEHPASSGKPQGLFGRKRR